MKLESLFCVKNNELYKIQDNSKVDLKTLKCVVIPWSSVEMEDEVYNEEYLANLRDDLKKLDDQNKFALLIPQVNKSLENYDQAELFINAFNHTARRIKDCISVTGFVLPEKLLSIENAPEDFMQAIAKKHEQYINFVCADSVNNFNLTKKDFYNNLVVFETLDVINNPWKN